MADILAGVVLGGGLTLLVVELIFQWHRISWWIERRGWRDPRSREWVAAALWWAALLAGVAGPLIWWAI